MKCKRIRGRVRVSIDDGADIVIELRETGLTVKRYRARRIINKVSFRELNDMIGGQMRLL